MILKTAESTWAACLRVHRYRSLFYGFNVSDSWSNSCGFEKKFLKRITSQILFSLSFILLCLTAPAQGRWVDIEEAVTTDSIYKHLNFQDTLSIDVGTDIIHVVPNRKLNNLDWYDLWCEDCDYAIGIMSCADVKTFLFWVKQFPPEHGSYNKNFHYQEIIEEKIWE